MSQDKDEAMRIFERVFHSLPYLALLLFFGAVNLFFAVKSFVSGDLGTGFLSLTAGGLFPIGTAIIIYRQRGKGS